MCIRDSLDNLPPTHGGLPGGPGFGSMDAAWEHAARVGREYLAAAEPQQTGIHTQLMGHCGPFT
eukprot:3110005-Alexandrium_andersonii.AAC.1